MSRGKAVRKAQLLRQVEQWRRDAQRGDRCRRARDPNEAGLVVIACQRAAEPATVAKAVPVIHHQIDTLRLGIHRIGQKGQRGKAGLPLAARKLVSRVFWNVDEIAIRSRTLIRYTSSVAVNPLASNTAPIDTFWDFSGLRSVAPRDCRPLRPARSPASRSGSAYSTRCSPTALAPTRESRCGRSHAAPAHGTAPCREVALRQTVRLPA